jgi:hypothetical protein
VNIDLMTNEELTTFYNRVRLHPRKTARELFPDAPSGFVTATKDLAHYAINKATALDCRDNAERDKYTLICAFIREKCLPDYACQFLGG